MRTLTVRQPYAHMIVIDDDDGEYKSIEVRSRPTRHRGPLAIHAAAKPEPSLADLCEGVTFGAVIGTVDLYHCRPLTTADLDAACLPDDFDPEGLWAWCLRDPRPCKPLPCKGKLGLWQTDDSEIVYL